MSLTQKNFDGRFGVLTLVLAALSLAVLTARANLAEDSFEGYPPGALSGKNGGTGWSGAWAAPASTAIANVVDASANPLTFTPVGGLTADGANRAVEVYSNPLTNNVATARQISGTLPDVFYVSYLVRLNAGAGWAANNTFSVHLANNAGNATSLNFGIRSGTAGQFMIRNGTGTPVTAATTGGQVVPGTNYLLVARFSKLGTLGTPTATYDRCELWVNPAANANQAAINGNARLQLADGTGIATISHVLVRQAALDADDRIWFDRLVVGANWDDVVPSFPDTNAPVISITSPTNGTPYAPGIAVNVAVTATDDRAVSAVQLYVDGSLQGADSTVPYQFTVTNLAIGAHTLTAVANDPAGNLGTNTVSITVSSSTGDTQPPVINITAPANGASFTIGSLVQLKATATDNVGVVQAEAYADGGLQGSLIYPPYNFNIINLGVGAHTLQMRALDTSGNAATNSVIVTINALPSGNKNALLVVGLSGTNASDLAISNRLQSLGYTVQVVLDTQSNTTNATGKTLILTSATVGSGNVNTKFRDVAVPVINWETFVQDDYGFTGTNQTTEINNLAAQTSLIITNAGHPLAAGLADGLRTVATTSTFSWGEPGGSPIIIARLSNGSHPCLYAYETGSAMRSGTAPARRVHLFLQNETFVALNTNGLALFDAAVSWAAGQSAPPPPQTKFLECSAIPGFFSGMDLYFEDVSGLKYFVWSSADVGLSVSNWTLLGQMNDTPLGNDPGRSVYGLNVTPTLSPTYYLIGKTNTGPYFTNVPAHKITSTDFVTFDLATTNTTINANGVLALNHPPVAMADSATTPEDVAVMINVLANDTDPDPSATLSLVSASSGNGTAVLAGTNVLYTPALNFNGTNIFSYVMSDGGMLVTGAVTVAVSPVNDAPVAASDSVTTPEDQAVTISVLANDTDADAGTVLSVISVSSPNGLASTTGTNVSYTPPLNFNGTNVLTYVISDGSLLATGAVAVAVAPVNDPPVAVADSATTPQDMAVTINVLGNDSDLDGDSLTLTNVSVGSGTASIVGTNLLFTPAAGFSGTNVFSYEITDGSLLATGSVTVVVTAAPVLVPPVLAGITANPDRSITLSVSVANGQSYQVQAAASLVPPVLWSSLITNISATTNLTPVTDTNTPDIPMRFYRLVSP